jgi:hypothetical protein
MVCLILTFVALPVFGDNCDYGTNASDSTCANNTNIENPPQSNNSTETQANRIALGAGIGVGIPTLISGVVLTWLTLRHWKRKERASKESGAQVDDVPRYDI